ncbi:MAG: type II toxin-antitoxin system VapC family toxin [Acidobacteriota bacterium]
MIVDSSALLAIVFREPGFEGLVGKLRQSGSTGIGTPTLTETGIVLTARLRNDPRGLMARMLQEFRITPVPFGEPHWREALSAFERFGKGRHPARLNFGDCMSYSTAKLARQPLLFVGNDFTQTDIPRA